MSIPQGFLWGIFFAKPDRPIRLQLTNLLKSYRALRRTGLDPGPFKEPVSVRLGGSGGNHIFASPTNYFDYSLDDQIQKKIRLKVQFNGLWTVVCGQTVIYYIF